MPALDTETFAAASAAGARIVDLRPPAAWAKGHIPGALTLQFGRHDLADRMALAFPNDRPYLLVVEPVALGPLAEGLLAAEGWSVEGHLAGGMKAWTAGGRPTRTVPTVTVEELAQRLAADPSLPLLDVREPFEYAWTHLEGSLNIPYGELWRRSAELDPALHWTVICADQVRSATAVSVLAHHDFERLTLVMGGMSAWVEAGLPVARVG